MRIASAGTAARCRFFCRARLLADCTYFEKWYERMKMDRVQKREDEDVLCVVVCT